MKKNIAGLVVYVLSLMCVSPLYAQSNASSLATRNEIGLVIGATEVPSIGLADGGNIYLNSSLALGVEYDRQLLGRRIALFGGIDFVAGFHMGCTGEPSEHCTMSIVSLSRH